jgi:hypothetical protein
LRWRVGEIGVKHISHLDEFAAQFDQLGMHEAKSIEGFDPNDLFFAHMSLVGYSSYFCKSEQFKEGGGDNQNLPDTLVDEALSECYRQKGKEVTNRNTNFNSPSVLQRSTPDKTKSRSSGMQTRKTLAENLDDGSVKDHTKKNLEKSHVVHTSTKIKRETQKKGLEIMKLKKFYLAMDVDEVLEEPN